MARNKHPEETLNRILDVSLRLFLEKGYEHTSIQDILDQLGGLSKGAIYHHFKSKEDILVAVTDRMTEDSNRLLSEILHRRDLNGAEKLRTVFKDSIQRPIQEKLFTVAPSFRNNPKLLFSLCHDTVDHVAPDFILPILREGLADGSIQTDYPEELAELIILVANIWMNPMIFDNTPEQAMRKFQVFDQMLRGFGLELLDEEMRAHIRDLAEIYQARRET